MTIRKNFLFEQEVAKHLEELGKAENKTQTTIVQKIQKKGISKHAKRRT